MTTMPPVLLDAVTSSQQLVRPALEKAIGSLEPSMARACRYHFGWADPEGAPVDGNSGKGLRQALVLLGARACHGDPVQAVPAAVAVELVHNFSLIHDDIMDGDVRRRHQPTVWAEYGTPTGVLAGDALLVLALDVLLTTEHGPGRIAADTAACLVEAVGELISGQSSDLDFERRVDVTLSEGLDMARGKTSALLRCAGAIGALSVSARAEQVEHLAGFGSHLGTAFQIVDDVLGIWGRPEVTGKPAMSDLRRRKKSLPVLAALGSGTGAGERLRDCFRRPDPFAPEELPGVARLVEDAGGRAWAEQRAHAEVLAARHCLDLLDAHEEDTAALRALADYVTGRDR